MSKLCKTIDPRKVYLKAMELIASGKHEFSCNAVLVAGINEQNGLEIVSAYKRYMSPSSVGSLAISDIEDVTDTRNNSKPKAKSKRKQFRLLLLAMMAAACKDLEIVGSRGKYGT